MDDLFDFKAFFLDTYETKMGEVKSDCIKYMESHFKGKSARIHSFNRELGKMETRTGVIAEFQIKDKYELHIRFDGSIRFNKVHPSYGIQILN